jgi:8-oxo-dGTP diphosphatase
VVLVRRATPPLLGRWSLPGGAVELGETLRAAAEREALEETGLIVATGEVLDVFDRILPAPDGRLQFHYVLVDFLCTVRGGKLRAGGDASEAVWAAEDELDNFKLEELALEVIKKAFSQAQKEGSPRRRPPQKAKTGLSGDPGRGDAEKN